MPAVSQEVATKLFARHCAICHGENGNGRGPRYRSLFDKPPDFRDPAWQASHTTAELRRAIRDGIAGSDMPSWKRLGDAEVAGLAEHVRGFGRSADATGSARER